MPSLRRALSSPSVRSSPYPTTFSSGAFGRVGAHGHRRSFGTETSSRRVLADIEWWSVVGGQREADLDQVTEERDNVLFALGGDESPSFSATENFPASPSPQTPTSPTIPFAALAATPHTPTRRHNISNFSSVESTPDASEDRHARLRLGIADLNLDSGFFSALPSLPRARQSPPPSSIRALVFTDLADLSGSYADFAVSPFCSPYPELFD